MRRHVPLIVVLVLSVNVALAQEAVDSPEFANWSRFPKGTSITYQVNTMAAGMKTDTKITTRLVEVGKEKLILETSSAVNINGMEFQTPPMEREVTKTLKLPEGVTPEQFAKGVPSGTYEEGTETLKVAGKSLKTQWFRFKTEGNGVTTESKVWKCDDVPGMMVKMEATVGGPAPVSTKMELVEFKTP